MDFPRQAQVSLNGIITTDTVHARTHSGTAYFCANITSLANDLAENWLIVVDSSVPTHMREVRASGTGAPFLMELFENTAVSSIGQSLTCNNMARISSIAASTAVSRTPVITTTGTLIDVLLIPGAKQDGAMEDLAKTEWILTPGKNYMLSFTNQSGVAIRMNPSMFWYEVK